MCTFCLVTDSTNFVILIIFPVHLSFHAALSILDITSSFSRFVLMFQTDGWEDLSTQIHVCDLDPTVIAQTKCPYPN